MTVDRWLSAWAKTACRDPSNQATVTHWLPLHQHLADAAGVAGRLVDEWVSPLVVDRVARDLDGDAAAVRTIATWLAAVHDVGKLSPAFVVQAPTLRDAMDRHGLRADARLQHDPGRSGVRHEVVSQLAVKTWLHEELGFPKRVAAAQLAGVVGAHHGVPPDTGTTSYARSRSDLTGDGIWIDARRSALAWAADLVGGPTVISRFASARLGRPTQALLAGIVIVADWVASNAEWFDLDPVHTASEPPRGPDPDLTAWRVASGWAALELPARWRSQPVEDVDAAFATRFGRTARPVQIAAVAAALTQPEPGLVVVEAPMGEGKTEAALLAAEALAARSGADGCFVALPTRATTDAMFGRVLTWMQALPGLDTDTSVVLAHGTANLNDRYRGLLRHDRIAGVGEGRDEVGIAHHWLKGRRRGPLAQFVVGTIDQVLFAGLKSRHLMLRHLGLAGKVVIIDECHAYDVYMARYLDTVLQWLGAYGTPVVLLSATLPAARRAELVEAYDKGRGSVSAPVTDDPGYPVVVASGLPPRTVAASRTGSAVRVERLPDDLDTLVDLLRDALAAGGCAVVVRNTVTRVQETADRLVEVFGDDDVTVTHSRFLACDRARLDTELLRRFGPPGPGVERPHRHVVVASQVVEQSLDVDFDLMVTDLAPIDLVLQRTGRLHRHDRPRPSPLEVPRCVLVGVEDWAGSPPRPVRGSVAVYGEHTLLRAAALLVDRDTVTLPNDIAPLVQAGYGPGELGPDAWRPAMTYARAVHDQAVARRREEAAHFLLGGVGGPTDTLEGWVRAGVGDAESDRRTAGRVRDGDESIEVLVVQRDADDGLLVPDWVRHGGTQLPLDERLDDRLARVVAACALRLPPSLCRFDDVGNAVIRVLEQTHPMSFHQHPLLHGELVLALDSDRVAMLDDGGVQVRLSYDLRRGLSCTVDADRRS